MTREQVPTLGSSRGALMPSPSRSRTQQLVDLAIPFIGVGAGSVTVALFYSPMALIPRPPYWPWLLGVGALAGLLASTAAMGVGWALARYVFDFSWNPSPWVPLAGGAAGALLALGAGWWGLRDVLRRPVVDTLRRAAE